MSLWGKSTILFFHLIRCILIIVSKYLKVRISCSTLLLLSFVNCDMRFPAAVFLRIFRIRPKDSVFECIIAHWRRDVVYSFSRQTFDRYLRFFGAIVSGPTMHSGSTFILKLWKYFKEHTLKSLLNKRACSLKFFKFSFHPARPVRNFSCNKQKMPPCSFINAWFIFSQFQDDCLGQMDLNQVKWNPYYPSVEKGQIITEILFRVAYSERLKLQVRQLCCFFSTHDNRCQVIHSFNKEFF